MAHVVIDSVTYFNGTVIVPIHDGITIDRTFAVLGRNIGHPNPNIDGHVVTVILNGITASGITDFQSNLVTQNGTEDFKADFVCNEDGTYSISALCLSGDQQSDGPYINIHVKNLSAMSKTVGPPAARILRPGTAARAPAAAGGRQLTITYPFLMQQFGFGAAVPRPLAFAGLVSTGEQLITHYFQAGPPPVHKAGLATVLGNFWWSTFDNVTTGPARLLVHTSDLALNMDLDINVI